MFCPISEFLHLIVTTEEQLSERVNAIKTSANSTGTVLLCPSTGSMPLMLGEFAPIVLDVEGLHLTIGCCTQSSSIGRRGSSRRPSPPRCALTKEESASAGIVANVDNVRLRLENIIFAAGDIVDEGNGSFIEFFNLENADSRVHRPNVPFHRS